MRHFICSRKKRRNTALLLESGSTIGQIAFALLSVVRLVLFAFCANGAQCARRRRNTASIFAHRNVGAHTGRGGVSPPESRGVMVVSTRPCHPERNIPHKIQTATPFALRVSTTSRRCHSERSRRRSRTFEVKPQKRVAESRRDFAQYSLFKTLSGT